MQLYRKRLRPNNPPEIWEYVAHYMRRAEFFVRADNEQAVGTVVSLNASMAGSPRINGDIPDDPWTSEKWSTCEVIEEIDGTSDPQENLDCIRITDVDGARAEIISYRRNR